MSEVYQYVDENGKQDENCLTVDFYFDTDTDLREAEKTIDKIIEYSDNKFDNLVSHRPVIFVVSKYSSIAETL